MLSLDRATRAWVPTHSNEAREINGSSLAIGHSVVASHNGAVTAWSQPDRGSTFTGHLPAAPSAAVTRPPAPQPIVRGHGRVLIMDDEEPVRHVAGKMAALLGYEAAFACDGEEALVAWDAARDAHRPFDVVIMDLTVSGGMGGLEATRRLLALDPEAQVVVSSGYSDDPVMANYREHGFRDILAKPYRVSDLSAVLSNLGRPG